MTQDPPRFFLVTPPLDDADRLLPQLEATLAAADVACLLVRSAVRESRAAQKIVRALSGPAQARGVAVLVPDDPQLAVRADADGCHVEAGDLAAALDALKPDRIVGVGALASRDDAMAAGEAGVDYLMFGGPGDADAARTLEQVGWWAEIFNVPCVGYAHTLAEVAPLVAAGADFIALGEACFLDPRGAAAALAQAQDLALQAHRAKIDAGLR